MIGSDTLEYFTTLIMKHGHYEEFLTIFEVLLLSAGKHNESDIYKKIVRCLLSPQKFNNINVIS